MGEREIVSLLISKIEDLKENLTNGLDKLEDKVESISDKLSGFEISTAITISEHSIEIKQRQLELEEIKKKVESLNPQIKEEDKKNTNWVIALLNNQTISTWVFRVILLILMTMFGIKKDYSTIISNTTKTEIEHKR